MRERESSVDYWLGKIEDTKWTNGSVRVKGMRQHVCVTG
jgi:hypothetical protein